MPQQIDPHSSPPTGPGAAQVSPTPQAGFAPHMHAPLTHASPTAQQVSPQLGPAQLPDGPHAAASTVARASGGDDPQ